eukprot:TRINITY_DN3555_c0_g2_i3.p1 TRINITY_DN3555_c0_g2~~TRINITY_DN3555_c0_g2_i3.p1  ORF type:complete len:349 (+),score=86.57 TRINITY_DN3555_c0_g2_i3:110-1156(+)
MEEDQRVESTEESKVEETDEIKTEIKNEDVSQNKETGKEEEDAPEESKVHRSPQPIEVKIKFPQTYPMVYKTLRLDKNLTTKENIAYIASCLNFSSGGTSGIGLAISTKGSQSPVFMDLDEPLLKYEKDIASADYIEYNYQDHGFTLNDETEQGLQRDLAPDMWNNPDLEGQLTKQGHVVKNWKLRYFILQHNKLFYFLSKPNKWIAKPTGYVLLYGATVSDCNRFKDRPMTLEITEKESGKVYLVQAGSQDEMDTWKKYLLDATSKSENGPSNIKHNLAIKLTTEQGMALNDLISTGNPEDYFTEFREIGRGGLAFGVYRAFDKRTNKHVAIKMINITAKKFSIHPS